MPFKRSILRYAHTNGHTHCTFTENGSEIITCGSDGDMRTWQGIDDDDPTSKCLGEFIISVVHYDNRILVSTDLNTVQAYNYPEISRDGTEFRFTAPANCIAVNKNYIVAGSEDSDIKILKKDRSENEIVLQGHCGPILSIDISTKDILASVSGDGSIKIWNINEKKEIKTFNGLPKVRSFEEVKCYGCPSFEPINGKTLAFCKEKEIIIISTETFEIQFTLLDDKITSDFSCCKFSNDGQYLAAGTRGGEICIWNFIKRQPISGETMSSECQSITSISWNPKKNGEIAYCDSAGQLGTLIDCTEETSKKCYTEKLSEFLDGVEEIGKNDNEFEDNTLPGEELIENDNGVSLEKLKNETMKTNGVDVEDFERKSINSLSESIHNDFGKKFKQQRVFQPGASPEDLNNRYLVWNYVGIVRSITSESDNSIHIEFHDVTTHHALHINNYWNHNMASLSSTVLALCSYNGNKLVCILLGGIGSREWSVELPNCEGIHAISATENIVAIATDNRLLRIFTSMGTQREVISLPGPVLSMCGRDNKLFLVYHRAPATQDQHISAILIQIFGPTLRAKEITVPITPEKKLIWIGFSDKGSPASSDTMGLVQMYSTKTSCWYPICDTMKYAQSVSNNFYLVEVLESVQQIHGVLCRGSTHPPTSPRPLVSELQMEVPLCAIDTQKSKFEENLIRLHAFNIDNSDRFIKEIALKLFALACHAELERRAKELIEMLGSASILPMAIKYAGSIGRIHLADRLSEIKETFENQEKEKEESEYESDVFSGLQTTGLNLLTSLNAKTDTTSKNVISPKPMVLGTKRNPFKRKSVEPKKLTQPSNENCLTHLTEKALGLEIKKTQLEEDSVCTQQSKFTEIGEIPCTKNYENKEKNEGPVNFMAWFNKNREELLKNNQGLSDAEITKIGMREYKRISNNVSNNSGNKFGKRKNDLTVEENQSCITKLAKFTFKN